MMTTILNLSLLANLLVFTSALTHQSHESRSPRSVGAAYFLSNEPSGNFVVTHHILSDGTVDFAGAISARGKGAHVNVTGPEPFGGQGSVQVVSQHLFTVNAGSNTVAMFKMNPENPAKLTMVGTPASSGGEFPISIGSSPRNGNVCVLNAGVNNGVQCFKADPITGLQDIPNTNRPLHLAVANPPDGVANAPSQVIFSADGSKLIVVVKSNSTQNGYLATWDVAPNGELSSTFTTSFNGGPAPFSATHIPGHDALLSADALNGFDIWDFSKGDKATASVFPVANQTGICWSTYSSKTGTFFLDDFGLSIVREVKLDTSLNASVIAEYSLDPKSDILENDVGTIGSEDYLYVLGAGSTSINVLALNGPGQAKHIQTYDFSSPASKAGIIINSLNVAGMSVFVAA